MLFRPFVRALAIGLIATATQAQTYPAKPIRMVIPFPPGGGTDILSRLVAQKLTDAHQWNIVPDNKPGAGGTLGITEAARGKPDGYEMVMGQKDNLVVGPWLYKNLPWNPVKDFTPVAHVAWAPVIIATSANSKYKTLADVIAAAKAAPDTVTYGSPGNGTTIHLAGDQFEKAAGIRLRHVPYKGSNPAMMDALAGNVDLLVSSVPSAMGQIKAGKLRPLAVTSAQRSSSLPDVPTVAESGFKGFDMSTWYGLLMPAGAPQPVVKQINGAVNELLARPDVKKAIHDQGAEPLALSPEAFARKLQDDYQTAEKIVRDAGVKIE
ncbi:tripartite tricarboxylate transporter substrate binding protein [Comamonadaceae bacterium OH2545_COT-014]|nr:tripartite tricarboxylate transporter substrate binding protein [Comamonadaceae bacterium OH2545_COT-014]